MTPEILSLARDLVLAASRVVFFTGAGLGAESGIPTFRREDGLWKGFRAEELASPSGFARDPERVWEWYRWRRSIIRGADLHAGHLAIASFCGRNPESTVVTQNVDGMHQRSGVGEVVELHGSIWRRCCQDCGLENDDESVAGDAVPFCVCGEKCRPGVVWFGEGLPAEPWGRAVAFMSAAEVVVVVGTSAVVQPAASLVGLARAEGASIIEVNPDPALVEIALTVASPASVALPAILR
jgi:NAD-dependent deacetylase